MKIELEYRKAGNCSPTLSTGNKYGKINVTVKYENITNKYGKMVVQWAPNVGQVGPED